MSSHSVVPGRPEHGNSGNGPSSDPAMSSLSTASASRGALPAGRMLWICIDVRQDLYYVRCQNRNKPGRSLSLTRSGRRRLRPSCCSSCRRKARVTTDRHQWVAELRSLQLEIIAVPGIVIRVHGIFRYHCPCRLVANRPVRYGVCRYWGNSLPPSGFLEQRVAHSRDSRAC